MHCIMDTTMDETLTGELFFLVLHLFAPVPLGAVLQWQKTMIKQGQRYTAGSCVGPCSDLDSELLRKVAAAAAATAATSAHQNHDHPMAREQAITLPLLRTPIKTAAAAAAAAPTAATLNDAHHRGRSRNGNAENSVKCNIRTATHRCPVLHGRQTDGGQPQARLNGRKAWQDIE